MYANLGNTGRDLGVLHRPGRRRSKRRYDLDLERGRILDREVLNLGFSGNCRMQPEVAALLVRSINYLWPGFIAKAMFSGWPGFVSLLHCVCHIPADYFIEHG